MSAAQLTAAFLVFISVSPNCWAVLGQKSSSVQVMETKLRTKATTTRSSQGPWSTQKIVADGNTITEYVAANGTVFAVSWRGIKQPDLAVLLGDYYKDYSAASAKLPHMHARHPILLKSSRLTVLKSGHMRDIRGLAFVPSLLPDGVKPEDLRK